MALERGELDVADVGVEVGDCRYRPISDAATDQVFACELTLKWVQFTLQIPVPNMPNPNGVLPASGLMGTALTTPYGRLCDFRKPYFAEICGENDNALRV
jgi:hypothetical protein